MAREPTIREVLERESKGEFTKEFEFDDMLWLAVCDYMNSLHQEDQDATLPDELVTYHSTRLLEWEVENGGFAQVTYNHPWLFEYAPNSYMLLGMHAWAALIREAGALATKDEQAVVEARANGLEGFASYCRRKTFDLLDKAFEELPEDPNAKRLQYVRDHREVLLALQPIRKKKRKTL